jgi:hypothetical protein
MSMPWERYDGSYTSGWDSAKKKPAKKAATKKTAAKRAKSRKSKKS